MALAIVEKETNKKSIADARWLNKSQRHGQAIMEFSLLNFLKKKNIIIALVLTTFMLTSCDSGSDNGTVGNRSCALVLLQAWLKEGK